MSVDKKNHQAYFIPMNTSVQHSTLPPRKKRSPAEVAVIYNDQLLRQALRLINANLVPFAPAITATLDGKLWKEVSELTGIPWKSLSHALALNPELRPLWSEARTLGEEYRRMSREQEAHRRAVDGIDEPVFYKGDECGHIRRYSDRLLEFLLKADNPQKYAQAETQVNLQTNILMDELQGTDVASLIGKTIDI